MVLEIQPQTFKSSYIKLIALLWSLVFSLIFSINLEIVKHARHVTEKLNIATLVFFVLFGVVYLITAIVYIVIRNVKRDCKCFKVTWLIEIAYFIGGILYYVGRNIPQILSIQDPCESETTCPEPILAAQPGFLAQPNLLAMVMVFYRFIPFLISKYYQSNLAKEHSTTEAKLQLVPEWILAAESMTLLVEFDSLFTITTYDTRDPHDADCKIISIKIWTLWVLFVLTYLFVLYYTMNIQYCRNCNANVSCVCNANVSCLASNFSTIVPLAGFGLYLVTYNTDIFRCTGANVSIAWLVMKVLVLIVVITAIVLLLVYRCLSKTRQDKLLPCILYQHLHPEPDEQELPLETENDNN